MGKDGRPEVECAEGCELARMGDQRWNAQRCFNEGGWATRGGCVVKDLQLAASHLWHP